MSLDASKCISFFQNSFPWIMAPSCLEAQIEQPGHVICADDDFYSPRRTANLTLPSILLVELQNDIYCT